MYQDLHLYYIDHSRAFGKNKTYRNISMIEKQTSKKQYLIKYKYIEVLVKSEYFHLYSQDVVNKAFDYCYSKQRM